MNVLETLLLVWSAGGVLSRDGDSLHIDATKGAIPVELLDALRVNKRELLTILPDNCGTSGVMPPTQKAE